MEICHSQPTVTKATLGFSRRHIDISRCMIDRIRPIDRVYLAKSAVVPLPFFSYHTPTVLLATFMDECYYEGNPAINHGLAVLSVERWMSALDPRYSAPVSMSLPAPQKALPITGEFAPFPIGD